MKHLILENWFNYGKPGWDLEMLNLVSTSTENDSILE